MKLTFIGAAHEVTGSCTLLECCGGNFLIDYGMEQGVNVFENVPLPVLPGQIDAVFLTHAHIDHSGMLPKLYKDGFRGKVYATQATENLCRIMLMDSAAIQMSDAEWLNRKAVRAGRATVDPAIRPRTRQVHCGCCVHAGMENASKQQRAWMSGLQTSVICSAQPAWSCG